MFDIIACPGHIQVMPVFYKIFRKYGLNTYQASVLFAVYNLDTIGMGVKEMHIAKSSAMERGTVKTNLNILFDLGLIEESRPRKNVRLISLNENGRVKCRQILDRLASYRGESINPLKEGETYADRMRSNKARRLKKLVNSPGILKEAIELIDKEKLGSQGNDLQATSL